MSSMNTNDVRKIIARRLRTQSASDLARELGISPQYLCDVIKGRKEPGDGMLRPLGLRRQVDIVRIS